MNCKILIKGSTARQTCCNRKKNPQVRNKCNNAPTQNQNSGNRQLGQQSATFNNDRNTQVGQQIGPKSAFNNQPGGKAHYKKTKLLNIRGKYQTGIIHK